MASRFSSLSKLQRGRIRSIAAEYWNAELRYVAKDGDMDKAKRMMRERIESRKKEIYGSALMAILGPILVKLAVALAVKLLEEWVKDQLFGGVEQGTTFRRGEL